MTGAEPLAVSTLRRGKWSARDLVPPELCRLEHSARTEYSSHYGLLVRIRYIAENLHSL